jgi:hypothetical protein
MPPEGNADHCQQYVESDCQSPFQSEVQPHVQEDSDASSELEASSPVRSESDASCESPSLAPVQPASDASQYSDSQLPCRKERPVSIKEEVRSTVEMFRRAADGAETVDNVLEEINRDRQTLGIGSGRDEYYSWMVNQQLIQENLLPEISFLYAKENFKDMARKGKITENSYDRFRAKEIEDRSPVDRLLGRYFMTALDYTGGKGPLRFYQKYFDMKDINDEIESARDYRFKKAEEQREVNEILSFLTEDDGKHFDQLTNEKAGGITRKNIKHARNNEDSEDRKTLNKILKVFRELSLGDGVITKGEIEYYAEKHGAGPKAIRFGS